jgi:hypothetical protein
MTNLPEPPAVNASDSLYACLTMYCHQVPLGAAKEHLIYGLSDGYHIDF